MDENREELAGAADTPDGAIPGEASRPLTRRELRLAAQAQASSAPGAAERAGPEPSSSDTGPVPHSGRAIGQLARAGAATPGSAGPLPTASPAWSPVRADGGSAGTPAPTAPVRQPVSRRRVREAMRDAPAPSTVVDSSVGATPAVPALATPPAPAVPAEPEPGAPEPAQDGTVQDGTVQDGTVQDGPQPAAAVQDGTQAAAAVQDGPQPAAAVQDGPQPAAATVDPLRSPTLPSVLPEEPDVDDVRWDGPVPPSEVVRTPLTRRAAPRVAPPPDDEHATGPVPVVTAGPAPVGTGPAPTPSLGATWTVAGPAVAGPAVAGAAGTTAGAGAAGSDRGEPVAGPPGEPVDAVAAPARTRPAVPGGDALPTLDDLLASRPRPAEGPAELGWRAVVRRASGGLLALPPGPDEQRVRESVAAVQRPLAGPKTVVVINPKGGAHKTTATLLLAATFGSHRGRSTLAWDNNETRGTLGWRSEHGAHQRTAVDLLEDLHRFEDPTAARVGDLDGYVRAQSAQFDVLASDEDAASAASIDAFAFRSLHRTLQRFYRVLVVDTGNNMRASNWQAAIEAADQVVVVSTVREDTSQSAAWALDALRAAGKEDVVRHAVTVLADPATRRDAALHDRLHDHFGRLTRVVLDVPYAPSLVSGGPLDVDALSRQTREAWLHVAAAVADGL